MIFTLASRGFPRYNNSSLMSVLFVFDCCHIFVDAPSRFLQFGGILIPLHYIVLFPINVILEDIFNFYYG